MTPEEQKFLIALTESNIISDSEKNLRSKIDSIVRSIENLTEKKLRIDFEIRRQKKTLTRKREELKRVSKRNTARASLTLESSEPNGVPDLTDVQVLDKFDQQLLERSFRIIEE